MEITQQKIDDTATEIRMVADEILVDTVDSHRQQALQQKMNILVQERRDLVQERRDREARQEIVELKKEIACVMKKLSRADIAPKRERILNDHLVDLRVRLILKEKKQSEALSQSLFWTPTMKMNHVQDYAGSIDDE